MPQLAYQLVVNKEAEHDDALSIHRDMNPLRCTPAIAAMLNCMATTIMMLSAEHCPNCVDWLHCGWSSVIEQAHFDMPQRLSQIVLQYCTTHKD